MKSELLKQNIAGISKSETLPRIICGQETWLPPTNERAFKKLLMGHTAYYNSLSKRRAGTVTLIPNVYFKHYHIAHTIIQRGYISYVAFRPKEHSAAPSFDVYNIYTATGVSHVEGQEGWSAAWGCDYKSWRVEQKVKDTLTSRKRYQFVLLDKSYRNAVHTFMLGDWNDNSLANLARLAKEQMLNTFGLRLHRQPLPTCTTGSNIDRIYSTMTEAEISILQPDSYIPFTSFSFTNTQRNRGLALQIAKAMGIKNNGFVDESNGKVIPLHPSDHMPVALVFNSIAPLPPSQTLLRKSLFAEQTFVDKVNELWELAEKPADPFAAHELFKIVLRRAKIIVRKLRKRPNVAQEVTEPLELLDWATRLYRLAVHPEQSDNSARMNALVDQCRGLEPLRKGGFDTAAIKKFVNRLIGTYCEPQESETEENSLPEASFSASWGKFRSKNKLQQIKTMLPSSRQRLYRTRTSEDEPMEDDPNKVAGIIADYWAEVWKEREFDQDATKWFLKFYTKRIDLKGKVITEETVRKAIKGTNDSSPGPDGVPFVAYRAFLDICTPLLYNIARAMMRGNTPPVGFNFGSLFVLPKDNSFLISKTRPISVPDAGNRIISKALLLVLTPATSTFIDSAQACLAGRNITRNIREFNRLFYGALRDGLPGYLLLLDFRKAFDSVKHKFVLAVLAKMGFPEWVIQMVAGFFANLGVYTCVSGAEAILIMVANGMKQGCPLSPLLYALIIDPLLTYLRHPPRVFTDIYAEHKLATGAYVDDLGLFFDAIEAILFVIDIVGRHSQAAGGGVNDDKTKLLATITNVRPIKAIIASSSWPEVKCVPSAVYLGVLYGKDVNTSDIFRNALAKFVTRVKQYTVASKRHWFSVPDKVIIANVWLLGVFFYLTQFFRLPTAYAKAIDKALAGFIVPNRAFTLDLLRYPADHSGLRQPLKDPDMVNLAQLAIQFTPELEERFEYVTPEQREALFTDRDGYQLFHCTGLPGTTRLMDEHVFLSHLVVTRPGEFGYNTDISCKDTRRSAYAKLTSSEYFLWYAHRDVRVKVYKLRAHRPDHLLRYEDLPQAFYSPSLPDSDYDEKTDNLVANWQLVTTKVPAFIRWHQCKIIFHALLTARRLRHNGVAADGTQPHLHAETLCLLCGAMFDDFRHIYFECTPVLWAYTHLRYMYANQAPETMQLDDLVLTSPKSRQLVLFQLIFNYAVWQARDHAEINSGMVGVQQFIQRSFVRLVRKYAPSILGHSNDRGTGKKSAKKTLAIVKFQNALADVTDTTIICYPDGSASPNPGPGGAGFCIRHGTREWRRYVSLGYTTNNVGEIYALGMIAEFIDEETKIGTFTGTENLFICPDSEYAPNVVNGNWKAKASQPLIDAVRIKIQNLNNNIRYIHCPAHVGIAGNEAADKQANKGTSDSRAGLGIGVQTRLRSHEGNFMNPINSRDMYSNCNHDDLRPP